MLTLFDGLIVEYNDLQRIKSAVNANDNTKYDVLLYLHSEENAIILKTVVGEEAAKTEINTIADTIAADGNAYSLDIRPDSE